MSLVLSTYLFGMYFSEAISSLLDSMALPVASEALDEQIFKRTLYRFRTHEGKVCDEVLFREDESRLTLVNREKCWAFDGDGGIFRIVSQTYRILLTYPT